MKSVPQVCCCAFLDSQKKKILSNILLIRTPTGFSHKSSRCTGPGVDAQLFWGTCTADDEPDQMVFTSSCTGNEVCTEIQYDEAQYMVCCVAIDFDDYLTVNGEAARFGISAAEMWMRQRYLAAVAVFMFWGTDSGGGGILGRDNTMTTVSQMRTLKASKLRIEAQEAKEMFGLTQYRTLDRGVAECDECERISLWPAPAGTTDIRVMVQVPEGTVGRLYLVPILA